MSVIINKIIKKGQNEREPTHNHIASLTNTKSLGLVYFVVFNALGFSFLFFFQQLSASKMNWYFLHSKYYLFELQKRVRETFSLNRWVDSLNDKICHIINCWLEIHWHSIWESFVLNDFSRNVTQNFNYPIKKESIIWYDGRKKLKPINL